MARARSQLMSIVLAAAALVLVLRSPAFVPSPARVSPAAANLNVQAASAAAMLGGAAALSPLPAVALDDDDEGFDLRILAVLALPLLAISWALFNVWRVAFRQVIRLGESTNGSSKIGLRPED